jgi:predicted Zn-dependent peptidase
MYEDLDNYRKTTLNNGIRIVTERVPSVQSVSLGIWVRSGSRFEQPEVNGICHFIEHMLFKGTPKRSAYTIAKEIDSVGGVLNAFTSKELTSYYCRILDEHLELAVDLLSDIFLNSSFPEDEIEREKQVICQEILQLEDSPEDLVHEILGTRFWRHDPLGWPILGTIPSVTSLDREKLIHFKQDQYMPGETVVCAAGNLDHNRFVELVAEQMAQLPGFSERSSTTPTRDVPAAHVEAKDLEQVHVCMGTEGPSAIDDRRHATYLLNTLLGGGMSSRLFQEIREKRALAYSVYSWLSSFSDTGMFGIYAGCAPERVEELLTTTRKVAVNLAETISEEEIQTAKNQIRGNIILGLESADARMNRLAKEEFYFGRHISLDEIIRSLEGVSLDELLDTAREIINPGRFTIVALGPVDGSVDVAGLFQQ